MQLTIEKLCKRYGSVVALDDLSCVLENGFHAILGPNGSGKTTWIQILTQNLRADGGRILCDGEDISEMGARFREKIGFVPQFPGVLPSFTLYDFLRYLSKLKGIDRKTAEEQIKLRAEQLELSEFLDRKLGGFSGGMKQRAAIAQALLGEPELLILDEPTAGLDPGQRVHLKNLLSAYAREHLVLFATHIVSDVEETATNLLFLRKGKLAAQGSPEFVKRQLYGKIWCFEASAGEKPALLSGTVLREAHTEDRVQYRVFSETAPCDEAVSVSPDLEDCYYFVFQSESARHG